MNVETLMCILEKVPDDYQVKYQDKRILDVFEIDVENHEIILK